MVLLIKTEDKIACISILALFGALAALGFSQFGLKLKRLWCTCVWCAWESPLPLLAKNDSQCGGCWVFPTKAQDEGVVTCDWIEHGSPLVASNAKML